MLIISSKETSLFMMGYQPLPQENLFYTNIILEERVRQNHPLRRINELIEHGSNFAFETTLSTRSYHEKVKRAQEKGYTVIMFFFWLNSVDLAIDRVKTRVLEGGHNILEDVIVRRYSKGIYNLFNIYIPLVDEFLVIDNSEVKHELIAEKRKTSELKILNFGKWNKLKQKA